MTPAERTAKIAELRAEADRLERWPEKVEAGMLFRSPEFGTDWISIGEYGFACIAGNRIGAHADYLSDKCVYLGHARDLLTIKTPDAPELTGAELVGRVCEFSDDGKEWCRGECEEFAVDDREYKYLEKGRCWWKFARLAKEQP